jgi:hypothetical protein
VSTERSSKVLVSEVWEVEIVIVEGLYLGAAAIGLRTRAWDTEPPSNSDNKERVRSSCFEDKK